MNRAATTDWYLVRLLRGFRGLLTVQMDDREPERENRGRERAPGCATELELGHNRQDHRAQFGAAVDVARDDILDASDDVTVGHVAAAQATLQEAA